MTPRKLSAIVLGAAAVGGLWWSTGRGGDVAPPDAGGAATTQHAAADTVHLTAEVPAAVFHTGLERLPASLAGTTVSGELEEDAAGHLVVTRGVRNVFDYFLSVEGEETRAVAVARIRAYVRSRLKPPAAAEALALLDRYRAYKDQLSTQQGSGSTGVDAALVRVRAMHDLRRRHFDPPVVAAFFGDDEAYDRYTMDKLALLGDTTLSPQVKATKLAELRARQPATLRDQMAETEQVDTLDAVTEQWKAAGGSPQALRQLRENLVGRDAADRLEALDRDTATWDGRVADFIRQRDALLQDPTLADSTRQQRIVSLRQQAFDAGEQVRIDTIERIRANAPRPPG